MGETDEEKLRPMCYFKSCPVAPSMQVDLFPWLDLFSLIRDEHLDRAEILRRAELEDADLDILHRLNALVAEFHESERQNKRAQSASSDPRKIAKGLQRR